MTESPKILLADNNVTYSETCAEFLELRGYQVRRAATPEEGWQLFEEWGPHLVIIDLRLRDDTDEKDVSGLTLAKQISPLIPKIILTAFPTTSLVREALHPTEQGMPHATFFVFKPEGLKILYNYVQRAFAEQVHVNWELTLDWQAPDRLALARLLEPSLTDEQLVQRARELEGLFRRLFIGATQVRIEKLLWERPGRAALRVVVFAAEAPPEVRLLACGARRSVQAEAATYRAHKPATPQTGVPTLEDWSAETVHFAAHGYALADDKLSACISLRELYQTPSGKTFGTALDRLFNHTLRNWSREKPFRAPGRTLAELYRAKLGLDVLPTDFTSRLQRLLDELPRLGLQGELRAGELHLRFRNLALTCPDPTLPYNPAGLVTQPALLLQTPGTLAGDTLLVDAETQVWLTDFAEAGAAPWLWNYVALEAAIRFDWQTTERLWLLYGLEQCLSKDASFSHFALSDYEAALHKPLRAIRTIRRLAGEGAERNPAVYHLGIYFQALSRLARAPLTAPQTDAELARLGQLLLSLALLSDLLKQSALPLHAEPPPPGLILDIEKEEVRVDGVRVKLTQQDYRLLCFLHERAHQWCARQVIIEQFFGYRYDETDESQEALVTTAVSRLRKSLEAGARHVLSERGRGYRLVL